MRKQLEQDMILDAKRVLDNAIPDLQDLYEMVPPMLHSQLETFIREFKSTLAMCAVSESEVTIVGKVFILDRDSGYFGIREDKSGRTQFGYLSRQEDIKLAASCLSGEQEKVKITLNKFTLNNETKIIPVTKSDI